jgi:hypothetical protein
MSQVNEPHKRGCINHTELENGETPYLYLDMYFDLTHEMYQYPEDGPLRAEICRSVSV